MTITFNQLLENAQQDVEKLFEAQKDTLIPDISEPYEYRSMRIQNALNVPRVNDDQLGP